MNSRQSSKGEYIALTQAWHDKGWDARQEEIDQLKAKKDSTPACFGECEC